MVTVAAPQMPVTYQQTTSPNGQAVRIWEPPILTVGAPLVLFNHHYTGNEQIAPGAGQYDYALICALIANGIRVAASNQHANNWGNQNSIDDDVDLYGMMNTRQAVSKVAIFGQSMGGLSACLLVPDGRIPIKGVALLDAVTNLANANNATGTFAASSASFSTSITSAYSISAGTLSAATLAGATTVTTSVSYAAGTKILIDTGTLQEATTVSAVTGAGPYTLTVPALTNGHASGVAVTDYGTKTAGHDPNLIAAASLTGVRWRMYQAQADTTQVDKTQNLDLWATKVAGAPEAGTVTHLAGHLGNDSANPADFMAFVGRCF